MVKSPFLSVVVPLYNESGSLESFHASLAAVLGPATKDSYEIIYCDDGSTDDSAAQVEQFRKSDHSVKLVKLSRNFGKENALAAGIAAAHGQAVLMLDGDGQHPVELIPDFLAAWKNGAQVVVGMRTGNSGEGWFKRLGSRFFHMLFNKLSDQKLAAGSSDFRLIDKSVRQAFLGLKESGRTTRGLIDWLGFKQAFVPFQAKARVADSPGYSRAKIMRLAADSFVSLSPKPLYLFGYLGVFITIGAFLLGSAVLLEQVILGDPWHWKFTGTAMLGILILFLVGILLLSQGILSLYISHIHNQSKGRPLYVVDYNGSLGIEEEAREG